MKRKLGKNHEGLKSSQSSGNVQKSKLSIAIKAVMSNMHEMGAISM